MDSSSSYATVFVKTPRGNTASTRVSSSLDYTNFLETLWEAVKRRDVPNNRKRSLHNELQQKPPFYLVHNGRILERQNFKSVFQYPFVSLQLSILGGVDRQNRVGSKFGGGGISSSQNAERERKERLKRLALESIDLAKDPYLMRNHLGTYECKLCLTLHPNEANYLAHTQGKKHQQGLARRAYLEKQKAEKEASLQPMQIPVSNKKPRIRKVRIGRPAYQVLKSRDPDTNQRCLSFELSYPSIADTIQPRHRFMSAFEQRIDTPADRRYQYLLLAADPYETVAFKIPNEPIDKGEDRFVTHWDVDTKKFTLSLYYLEDSMEEEDKKPESSNNNNAFCIEAS